MRTFSGFKLFYNGKYIGQISLLSVDNMMLVQMLDSQDDLGAVEFGTIWEIYYKK